VIAYRAMLDVPRELVRHLAGLLAAERRVLGTRKKTRALTCWYHALLVLAWYRKGEDLTLLAAGFGISRATAYRYRDEATRVLAATAPDLHDALRRVAVDGWSHVILDGKVFTTDRCAETTTSVKGKRSTPGTPESTATSAPTSKQSCVPTAYRSGHRPPRQGTCTT
jgi:hypothetical protein